LTSAPNLLRASVVKTECSLLISLGAEVCPTSVTKQMRRSASVCTTERSLINSPPCPTATNKTQSRSLKLLMKAVLSRSVQNYCRAEPVVILHRAE
jgi:hypothetical protein